MLVSDGGDRLDPDARERIAYLARKHRVAIYWIYLRSANSPGLVLEHGDEPPAMPTPCRSTSLHRFFESLRHAVPRLRGRRSARRCKRAIDDVNRLENLPITYLDTDAAARPVGAGATRAALLACCCCCWRRSLVEIRRWA